VPIEPDELIRGRRQARARVVATGLTDEDIDRLIDEARAEAKSLLGSGTWSAPMSLSARRTIADADRGSFFRRSD
jgi:hypothetical protein